MTFTLHHVAMTVQNLDESVRWYREVLGFVTTMRMQRPDLGAEVAFLEAHGLRLELFSFAAGAGLPKYRCSVDEDIRVQGTKHIALEVADIHSAVRSLLDKDVSIVEGPCTSWNGANLYAFFIDPSGVLIELFQRLSDSGSASSEVCA